MNFFVIAQNRWGHSTTELDDAMRKARLFQPSRLSHCIEGVEEYINCIDDDDDSETVQDFIDASIENYQYERKMDEQDFIVIAVSDDWKLAEVDPIGGSPSWKWMGDGPMPELKQRVYRMHLNEDGSIKHIG